MAMSEVGWRCLGCQTSNDPSAALCLTCGKEPPSAAQVVTATLTDWQSSEDGRRPSTILRLASAVGTLIWGDGVKFTKQRKKKIRRRKKSPVKAVEQPKKSEETREPTKNVPHRPSQKQVVIRHRDVNNNTQSTVHALEKLVGDKTGNSEVGSDYLRRLVMPELEFADQLCVSKTHRRTSFDASGVNQELLDAVQKEPKQRTSQELVIIDSHIGWHPVFQVARGRLKPRMLKHIRLLSPKQYAAVVLQGEIADAAYIVYSGRVAVHIKNPDNEVRKHRLKYLHQPLAKDLAEYHTRVEHKVGNRVAFLSPGNAFGENGLDTNRQARRNATIVALERSTQLLCIRRDDILPPNKCEGGLLSFDRGPHQELMRVLRIPAHQRTDADLAVVLHHCAWQPFFASMERSLALVACRHLTLVQVPADTAVVLQGDTADSYYIVYHGQAEVYITKNESSFHRWKGLNLWNVHDEQERTVLLPIRKAGKKVFVLKQGMAFGESGLDPSGPKRRTATIISLGGPDSSDLMLLALYQCDVRADNGTLDPHADKRQLGSLDDHVSEPCDTVPRRKISFRSAAFAVLDKISSFEDYITHACEEPRYRRSNVVVKLERKQKGAQDSLKKARASLRDALRRKLSLVRKGHRSISPAGILPHRDVVDSPREQTSAPVASAPP